jgi:flagellar biosynthesis GTPase FlhF
MNADLKNQELIARYLLGDLAENQQIDIEDRAFRDEDYRQNIMAVENDLIDEYVRNELSESQRGLFESRFLRSDGRRRRVEFARALSAGLTEAKTMEPRRAIVSSSIGWRESLTTFLQGLAPANRFALAAAALLIIAGGAWLITQTLRQGAQLARLQANQQSQQDNRQALAQQIEAERKRNQELTAQLENEKQQRGQSDEVAARLQREAESKPQPARSTMVTLALLAGISRGSNARPKLILPESAQLVRLQIGVEPEDQYQSFRVQLLTQDGRQVLTRDHLSASSSRSGKTIGLILPANLITAGQYELALKGVTDTGTSEALGYYYFSVSKK